MNPGSTIPPPGGSPIPTTRQFISDTGVQLLADAYGYTVVLPSALDTAHATLDSETGTLLIQGGLTTAGAAVNDTIDVSVSGSDILVTVNGTTELVLQASVTQIGIAGNGGADSITVASALAVLRKDVQYVVSSNQDSAAAGTLGDGVIDLDPIVPGRQVALRSAIGVTEDDGQVDGADYLIWQYFGLQADGDDDGDVDSADLTIWQQNNGNTLELVNVAT